ncbi:MAG: hypothetical protein IIT98_00500 [Kiritimatiellae bacterium]|nr:hypothetical protein [Kiritimatiellia bacterium]
MTARQAIKALAAAAGLFACAAVSPYAEGAAVRAPAKVAVLSAEQGYYASLARHAARWLAGQGVESSVAIAPADAAKALGGAKLALLVGYDSPDAAQIGAFKNYLARGGKLVVFYSSSPSLAALMGVKILGFKRAPYPGCWSRMVFDTKQPAGCPAEILQTSTVLQRAEPVRGRSRTMAFWADRNGRRTGDAAWIASSSGYWMTHVLLADGDESLKARLLAAIAGGVDRSLWDFESRARKEAAERKALLEYASRQNPKPGEIHAVWDHSGCGLYPGDWRRTIDILRRHGVTDIFLCAGGPGFANYASSVLPRSKTFSNEGDQLAACIAAAKSAGIRVHAWLMCFNATRSSKERIAAFSANRWLLKTKDGRESEYLDPSVKAVRELVYSAIDELCANYEIAGVHLDFVRWYEKSAKPAGAVQTVTRFVAGARTRVPRPLWLTAAVLGKYPSCVDSVGQDWTGWLGNNLVDYVVPMDYTEDISKFESFAKQHAWLKTHARRTIAGIGVTANESRLGAKQTIAQILVARKYNLAGEALFDLDATLEKDILPYLSAGVWK